MGFIKSSLLNCVLLLTKLYFYHLGFSLVLPASEMMLVPGHLPVPLASNRHIVYLDPGQEYLGEGLCYFSVFDFVHLVVLHIINIGVSDGMSQHSRIHLKPLRQLGQSLILKLYFYQNLKLKGI